jgi:hypothetical protein
MNRKRNSKYLIFNISTSEVSCAVVFFDKVGQKPFIEYSFKKKIFVEGDESLVNFKKNTRRAIKSVSGDILKYIKISGDIFNTEEAFVFMSSPWTRKSMETIVEEKIKPFLVKNNFLEHFLSYSGSKNSKEVLLSSDIFSVKANGYKMSIEDIFGKYVSELKVSMMNSYITEENQVFVNDVLREDFSFVKITSMPFLPVLFSQIRRMFDTDQDFVFMDLTGEIIEFGVYKDGGIKSMVSIKSGRNKITRGLVLEGLANSMLDSEYILSLYLKESLEKNKKERVKKVIDFYAEQIKKEISRELEKYDNFEMPKKAFIVSSGEINYLLKEMNFFEENYFINKSFLKKFVSVQENKYFDNFLALEAEYIFE